MNYSVILTINALTSAVAILWLLRRRRNQRMLHEPRAMHLLVAATPEIESVCRVINGDNVVRVFGCPRCVRSADLCVPRPRPLPMPIPGPGVRRLG